MYCRVDRVAISDKNTVLNAQFPGYDNFKKVSIVRTNLQFMVNWKMELPTDNCHIVNGGLYCTHLRRLTYRLTITCQELVKRDQSCYETEHAYWNVKIISLLFQLINAFDQY